MAIGDYRILATDSCGYSIWMTINIPNADPYRYQMQARNNIDCIDTVAVNFMIYRETNIIHDYDLGYLDSIIQYSVFTVELDGDEFVLFWHGVEDECPFTTELVGTDYALNFTYQDSNIL